MKVQMRNPFTGEKVTREMDVTIEQVLEHERGGLVQDVFPHLDADDREFLITGLSPKQWEARTKERE